MLINLLASPRYTVCLGMAVWLMHWTTIFASRFKILSSSWLVQIACLRASSRTDRQVSFLNTQNGGKVLARVYILLVLASKCLD